MLKWDLLRWEFTSINAPAHQYLRYLNSQVRVKLSEWAYQLTYHQHDCIERGRRHTKYPTVFLLLITSSVEAGKCCLILWTTVVWLKIQLRPMNRRRPVKMVDLLILCCAVFVFLRVEDMQCDMVRSQAVQCQDKNTSRSGVAHKGVSTSWRNTTIPDSLSTSRTVCQSPRSDT